MTTNRKTNPRIWQPTFLLNHALNIAVRRAAERYFALGKTNRVVDIGCGSMPYRKYFIERCAEYIGCDQFHDSPDVIQCPADQLPFADGSLNAALCFQVIEHVPFPAGVFREAARVLTPGGVALFTAPFLFPFHASPNDYFRYTHEGLEHLGRDAGLSVLEITAQCDTWQSLSIMANIKLVEHLGRLRKLIIFGQVYGLIEACLIACINTLGLLGKGQSTVARSAQFPVYSNYVIVLAKQKAT